LPVYRGRGKKWKLKREGGRDRVSTCRARQWAARFNRRIDALGAPHVAKQEADRKKGDLLFVFSLSREVVCVPVYGGTGTKWKLKRERERERMSTGRVKQRTSRFNGRIDALGASYDCRH
jgi:hypothetical protein